MALALEILPFAILAGVALLLAGSWDAVPARFPIHWGLDGVPNGWASRSAAGVYGPLALGALLCGVVLAVRAVRPRKLSEPHARYQRRVLLATEYVLSVTFATTGLLPLLGRPGPVLAVALGSAGLLIAYAVAGAVRLARTHPPPAGGREHWKWGLFYVNPDDPALFVPKRFGVGWTLNFGRRAAWLALVLLLAVPLAVAVVVALLM